MPHSRKIVVHDTKGQFTDAIRQHVKLIMYNEEVQLTKEGLEVELWDSMSVTEREKAAEKFVTKAVAYIRSSGVINGKAAVNILMPGSGDCPMLAPLLQRFTKLYPNVCFHFYMVDYQQAHLSLIHQLFEKKAKVTKNIFITCVSGDMVDFYRWWHCQEKSPDIDIVLFENPLTSAFAAWTGVSQYAKQIKLLPYLLSTQHDSVVLAACYGPDDRSGLTNAMKCIVEKPVEYSLQDTMEGCSLAQRFEQGKSGYAYQAFWQFPPMQRSEQKLKNMFLNNLRVPVLFGLLSYVYYAIALINMVARIMYAGYSYVSPLRYVIDLLACVLAHVKFGRNRSQCIAFLAAGALMVAASPVWPLMNMHVSSHDQVDGSIQHSQFFSDSPDPTNDVREVDEFNFH